VRQPVLVGGERVALARLRRHGADLVHLIGQQIQLALAVARGLGERRQLRRDGAPRGVRLGVRGEGDDVAVAAEAIEERGLCRGREEPLGVMLAVDLNETLAELGEGRRRGELPAHARRTLAVRANGAREDELTVLGVVRVVVGIGRGVEPRLDPRRGGALADEGRRPAPAEGQSEANRHHRFAGPGLAGQHVQAGMQLEIEVVDDAQSGDAELVEHARSLARGTDGTGHHQ